MTIPERRDTLRQEDVRAFKGQNMAFKEGSAFLSDGAGEGGGA